MATVTIRGSITPSAWLARGEVKTVQRTSHIDNLIRQGFVDLLAEHNDVPAAVPPAEAPVQPDTPKPPHKNASREDWAEFLSTIPDLTDHVQAHGRDQLVGIWESYEDGQYSPGE